MGQLESPSREHNQYICQPTSLFYIASTNKQNTRQESKLECISYTV